MTCFVHFITAPWCFSSTCNPVQATQSRFPLSLHQLNSLRVLAIHWLHCRAGLTWSLFLTHPLSVFNHRLSCPACSAVGLVALSSHHCSPEVPEGLQKGCAFVHLFSLTAEVFVVMPRAHLRLHRVPRPAPQLSSAQEAFWTYFPITESARLLLSAIPDVDNPLPVFSTCPPCSAP